MTEAELEAEVRRLLADRRLYGYHPYDSRRDTAGWPDWVILGRGRILYRELKTDFGQLSPEQSRVRNLLVVAGADWDIWRPVDLRSGRIQRELAALSVNARTAPR